MKKRQEPAVLILVAASAAWGRPDLYSNGPWITGPGQGAGNADVSALPTYLGSSAYGFNCQILTNNARLADDFTVPAGGWTLTSVAFPLFQSGATTTTPTIESVNLRIWRGRPGDAGSTVLFGNATLNRLASATWSGGYRTPDTDPLNTQRAIYLVVAAINPPLALDPGTYWVDWQAGGTLNSGPWSVPVTLPGVAGAPGANARSFFNNVWSNLRDQGSITAQELAFILRGTAGTGQAPCYANCDGSTELPFLNVNDFICFQSAFAAGLSSANCDGSTTLPTLNVNDFICFQSVFAAGCSAP